MLSKAGSYDSFASARPPLDGSPAPTGFGNSESGFEFKLTDIAEARRILDNESMTQFEVSALARPEQWKRLRRRSEPTDRAIAGHAIDWMLALPPSLRPQLLSSQFPRVVNELAKVWNDPEQCQIALDKLLYSDRPDRAGFPPAVRAELIALRNWVQVF